MTRHIALLAALGITVSCGGSDPTADPMEREAQRGPATALVGERGKCEVSMDHTRLTGTCLEEFMCDFFQDNNTYCLNRTPRGPFVRDQNCGGVPIDLGSSCRYQGP